MAVWSKGVTRVCPKPYSFVVFVYNIWQFEQVSIIIDTFATSSSWHCRHGMVTLGNFLNRHGQLGNLTSFLRIYYVSFLTQVCRAYMVYIVYLEALRCWKSCAGKMCLYTWVTENEQGAPVVCRRISVRAEFCKWLERLFPDATHWHALECIHHCRQAASPSWEATNRRCDRGQMNGVRTFCVPILFDSNDSMFQLQS